MKTFENPRNIKEFVNQFGETMTMVMSDNSTLWIYHNDCNKDFEKLDKFYLKYVLDKEEQIAIIEFVEECEIILEKGY